MNIQSIKQPRFLTLEEAGLVEEAAEQWLRMRDVEFNAGEDAAALVAAAQLRASDCTREDIAALGRTILLGVPWEPEPVPITLVRPRDEDLWRGRVSVLSELGLACLGHVRGSTIRMPHGHARLVGITTCEKNAHPQEKGARA